MFYSSRGNWLNLTSSRRFNLESRGAKIQEHRSERVCPTPKGWCTTSRTGVRVAWNFEDSRKKERKKDDGFTLLGNEARHLARQTSQRQPEAPTASPTIRWGQSPSHKEGPLPWRPRTFIQGVLLLPTYYCRPETRNRTFRSHFKTRSTESADDRKRAYCKKWGKYSTNKKC